METCYIDICSDHIKAISVLIICLGRSFRHTLGMHIHAIISKQHFYLHNINNLAPKKTTKLSIYVHHICKPFNIYWLTIIWKVMFSLESQANYYSSVILSYIILFAKHFLFTRLKHIQRKIHQFRIQNFLFCFKFYAQNQNPKRILNFVKSILYKSIVQREWCRLKEVTGIVVCLTF